MTRVLMFALTLATTGAIAQTPPPPPPPVAIALDGDTFRYDGETIRLLGIDAPELAGHCRVGRDCVEGDADASKASLQEILNRGKLSIFRVTKDRYGRTVAAVRANRIEVSCYQLRHQQAMYVAAWDNYGIVRQRCPASVRTIYKPAILTSGERG